MVYSDVSALAGEVECLVNKNLRLKDGIPQRRRVRREIQIGW